MTTRYIGQRFDDGARVYRISDLGQQATLPLRLDLDNHSPTGFEWGYAGSGPAQLALAILADALGNDDKAKRLHQLFKAHYIQNITLPEWALEADEVRRWAADNMEDEHG